MMRRHVLGLALASLVLGCGDDGQTGRLAPDTGIDDKPAALSNQRRAVIAFHGAGEPDHFTCALDGAAEATCTSPYQADVADGEHAFIVRAAIGATVDETPADYHWKVDTVAPDTAITAAPPALDNAAAPALEFAGTDDNGAVTLECALDAAAFAACTSPATLSALVDGSHTFQVRAIDGAGNIDPTPASATWTLDSRAPDTMIVGGPAAGASTKADVSLEFSSPDSPVTFECAVDAAAFAACTSPQAYTLAEGPHTFAVRAKDAAGLADPSPAMRAWIVDTTAPVVAITSGPTALTNDSTPTFGFTVTGATTIECQVDSAAFAACTSPFTTPALADGRHAFAVRGTDAAGNTAAQSRTFTVDTVPPVVHVTAVASPTRDNTPSVAFTVTGATAVQCQVDGGALAACSSPFTTPALADGSHTVTVRATDAANNPGSDATTFTVDATPPGVAIDDAPPALWPVNYFDLKFHTADPTASLTCSLNGAAFTACASPLAITTTYNIASTFAVRATDPAGNVATTAPATWTAQNGLVLHYPWEQGQTHNTSLLAQNPPYSPDGTTTLTAIGGWAGTAANSPTAHTYKSTIRPLSSSANGQYTASLWVRVAQGSNGGLLFSNLAANNGLSLSLAGRQVQLVVHDNGQSFTTSAVVPPGQWVQIAVITTGPSKGVQLLINGNVAGTAAAPTATGFGAGQ
ncbi:MAG: Ig-like domain-containing protein, partial [Kofleriaceae bacterium]